MLSLLRKLYMAESLRAYLGAAVILVSACSIAAVEASEAMPQNSAAALEGDTGGIDPNPRLESPFSTEITAFYRARFYRPVWVDKGVLNADGRYLLQTLIISYEHGIDPLDRIGLWSHTGQISSAQAIIYDQVLTDLFLRYSRAVRIGRVSPRDAGIIWAIQAPSFDAAQLLGTLDRVPLAVLLSEQPPPHAGYSRMASALVRYREIESRGGWPLVPEGPVLERGQTGQRVSVLRRRLDLEGYGPFREGEHELFSEELEQAVKTFQQRHGLAQDGRVGRESVASLNVSAEQRVEQIQLNMERWRWMTRELPARRIEVNIAAAELELFDAGRLALSMKTIVGSPRHPTPMLRSEVRAVIVNPVWNVPDSITRNEILPRLRRDSDYLRAQDMLILDRPEDPYGLQVNWKRGLGSTRPRLQQQPGPLNALGRLKFDMPNPFDVYLHDTPARALFDRSARALSHGCIRLQFPNRLAAYLLHDPDEKFSNRIGEKYPTRLELDDGIPVYLVYWTVFVPADDNVHFREDIYGHDARMRMALRRQEGLTPIASASQGGCRVS